MAFSTTSNIVINDSPDDASQETVACCATYEAAQATVDRPSDASFPVGYVEIVGRDLRLVERVTGGDTTSWSPRDRLSVQAR